MPMSVRLQIGNSKGEVLGWCTKLVLVFGRGVMRYGE